MKSSTLRRSNLSKERMLILEELAKNKQKPYDDSPSVYVRANKENKDNKEKELDVLWQNFRVSQKEEKSAGVYLITGFIAGAVSMLIVITLVSFLMNNAGTQNFGLPAKQNKEHAKLTFIPADKTADATVSTPVEATGANETYTVKSGDTIASIIIRFYGKYDVSKIEKIKQANKMANPNSVQIGQKLIIPMN